MSEETTTNVEETSTDVEEVPTKVEETPEKVEHEEVNAYKEIINQQQAQINALLDRTNKLNEQIVNLVQSGGQFAGNDKPSEPAKSATVSLEDDMISFEDIAKEIGKR